MASPGTGIASRFPPCWQPITGIALTALGAWLVYVGLLEPTMPDRQTGGVPTPRVVNDGDLAILTVPGQRSDDVLLSWDRVAGVAKQDGLMFREPALRPRCLKADLVAEPALPPKECGAARIFLAQSASARWLAPRFRDAEEWSETSGYGAIEASRAKHLGPVRTIDSSLECAVGAEYQETPSCSVISETALPFVEAGVETHIDTRFGRQ